jgi:hypothetical protein
MFAGTQNRHRSDGYKAWIKAAGWELVAQRPRKVKGRYELTIVLPAKMIGDIGNREKAVSDLLVTHEVVEDDKLAWRITIMRAEEIEAVCLVAVSEFEEPANDR